MPIVCAPGYTRITARQELGNKAYPGELLPSASPSFRPSSPRFSSIRLSPYACSKAALASTLALVPAYQAGPPAATRSHPQ